jgi:hypothetical protein
MSKQQCSNCLWPKCGVLQLALVVLLNLELEKLDVKTTFLHGDLDEETCMEQPEGFV